MRLFRKPAAVRIPDRTLHVTRAKGSTARPFFMEAGDELAYYGTVLTGRPFGRILLRDAPETEDDNQWVQLEAKTRLKPDGAIFHDYRAEPKPEPAAKPVTRAGVLHVYQTQDRAAIFNLDLQYPDRAVAYGYALGAYQAATIVLRDAPASEADKVWLRDGAITRLAPGGNLVHDYPGPVVSLEPDRPRFTFAGTTGRGCYAFTPDNEAARAILPHGADQWTTTPEYFWTGETAE